MLPIGSTELQVIVTEAIKELAEKYNPADVKKRPDGILYVETFKVLETMNEKFGLFWGGEVTDIQIVHAEGYMDNTVGPKGKLKKIRPEDDNYKTCMAAIVTCNIYIKIYDKDNKEILHTTRPGIGADEIRRVSEIDSHVKTALANAVKKGFINFGNMLYLWVEEERSKVGDGHIKMKDLTPANIEKLGKFVEEHSLSKEETVKLVAEVFGKGAIIDGHTYTGLDKTVFLDPEQDKIMDYFLVAATNLYNQE